MASTSIVLAVLKYTSTRPLERIPAVRSSDDLDDVTVQKFIIGQAASNSCHQEAITDCRVAFDRYFVETM